MRQLYWQSHMLYVLSMAGKIEHVKATSGQCQASETTNTAKSHAGVTNVDAHSFLRNSKGIRAKNFPAMRPAIDIPNFYNTTV